MADGLKLIAAIADGIADKAEIHRAMDNGSEHLDTTYYEEGVMLWIIRDVTARDPAAAAKMDELLMETGLKKVDGGYAISAEDAAEHMAVPVEEARGILQEMQAESFSPAWDQKTGSIQ